MRRIKRGRHPPVSHTNTHTHKHTHHTPPPVNVVTCVAADVTSFRLDQTAAFCMLYLAASCQTIHMLWVWPRHIKELAWYILWLEQKFGMTAHLFNAFRVKFDRERGRNFENFWALYLWGYILYDYFILEKCAQNSDTLTYVWFSLFLFIYLCSISCLDEYTGKSVHIIIRIHMWK